MKPQNEDWPRDALPKGSDLNGYRIQAVIGRGGFGITYRAVDGIDQAFAVKEYFPKQFAVRQQTEVWPSDQESDGPFRECLARFGAEARALRQLAATDSAGEGIVKVVTFFQVNGTAYVVMEMLEGDSLEKIIRATPSGMNAKQLAFIVPRLLHSVGRVHNANLLHRDIKPSNIILREDGRPVLIDFGAVRAISQGNTMTFTQIFSEGYAPIEQFSGSRQGPFSDIYALGATFYRAIGGINIDAFTRHQAVIRGKPDPLPPASQVGAPRYNQHLLAAIDAAMTVSPDERPQSVAELLAFFQDEPDRNTTLKTPRLNQVSDGSDRAESGVLPPIIEQAPARSSEEEDRTRGQAQGRNAARSFRRRLAVVICIVSLSGLVFVGTQWLPRGGPPVNQVAPLDEIFWRSISRSTKPDDFNTYLQRFPNGHYAPEAQMQLSALSVGYWRSIANSSDPTDFHSYLDSFPQGEFAALARERLSALATRPPSEPVLSPDARMAAWSAGDRKSARRVLNLVGKTTSTISDQAFTPEEREAAISYFVSASGRPLPGVSGLDLMNIPAVASLLTAILVRGNVSPSGISMNAVPDGPGRFARGWAAEHGSTPANSREAAFWYALAAREGYLPAYTELGVLLSHGIDGVMDVTGASLLWWIASLRGDETASYNLGAMYENGIGVASSPDLAARWYRLAANAGATTPARDALRRLGR